MNNLIKAVIWWISILSFVKPAQSQCWGPRSLYRQNAYEHGYLATQNNFPRISGEFPIAETDSVIAELLDKIFELKNPAAKPNATAINNENKKRLLDELHTLVAYRLAPAELFEEANIFFLTAIPTTVAEAKLFLLSTVNYQYSHVEKFKTLSEFADYLKFHDIICSVPPFIEHLTAQNRLLPTSETLRGNSASFIQFRFDITKPFFPISLLAQISQSTTFKNYSQYSFKVSDSVRGNNTIEIFTTLRSLEDNEPVISHWDSDKGLIQFSPFAAFHFSIAALNKFMLDHGNGKQVYVLRDKTMDTMPSFLVSSSKYYDELVEVLPIYSEISNKLWSPRLINSKVDILLPKLFQGFPSTLQDSISTIVRSSEISNETDFLRAIPYVTFAGDISVSKQKARNWLINYFQKRVDVKIDSIDAMAQKWVSELSGSDQSLDEHSMLSKTGLAAYHVLTTDEQMIFIIMNRLYANIIAEELSIKLEPILVF